MSVPRDQLKSRVPPSMTLSDGSSVSRTARSNIPVREIAPLRAKNRFGVKGNAIVTGGAGGIGSVACRALLEHGLQGLAIFDLDSDTGSTIVNDLKTEFPSAAITFIRVDVTNAISVAQAVAEAEQQTGSVNICICFAGIALAAHALDITQDQWNKMFDVNCTGAFLCAQAVARAMKRNGTNGSIVLMSSISGHIVNYPQPQVHYNAAKCAVLSMKSSLAAEWAQYGIRVNSISPGYIDTVLNEGDGLAEHRRIWTERTPFGRMGQPEELTGAIILLVSQAGSYITGTDILVDGGISVL